MEVDRLDDPKVRRWRYFVPGGKIGWGAIVYIESSGLFLAYSDWGTYAHRWTAPGGTDIREFFLRPTMDYFISKLAGARDVLDVDATQKAIQRRVRELRRSGALSAEQAREEIELSKSFTNEVELAMGWWSKTKMSPDDTYGLQVSMRPPQAVAFCKIILPKLAKMIEAELDKERSARALASLQFGDSPASTEPDPKRDDP